MGEAYMTVSVRFADAAEAERREGEFRALFADFTGAYDLWQGRRLTAASEADGDQFWADLEARFPEAAAFLKAYPDLECVRDRPAATRGPWVRTGRAGRILGGPFLNTLAGVLSFAASEAGRRFSRRGQTVSTAAEVWHWAEQFPIAEYLNRRLGIGTATVDMR